MIIIIIFDLEGVLIDNRDRYYKALKAANPLAKTDKEIPRNKRRVFWNTFFDPKLSEELDKVNPTALELLSKYIKKGKKIVILSGSKKGVVKVMIRKIKDALEKRGIKFEPTAIIWRGEKDYRKAHIYKIEKAKELEALIGEEVEEVHDDDPMIIKEFEKQGVKAVLWRDLKPVGFVELT